MDTCIRNDFRFQLMELGIQHLMRDSLSLQKAAQLFGSLNGNRTNQDRLPLGMGLLHCLHNRMQLFFSGLVNRILMVNSLNRPVGGNLDNVHAVNITEFLFLSECGTCHTCFFLKFIKEVLEGNGRQRLAFSLDLYVLLRFNRLMESVGITAARHDTSGKFIDDQNLVVLYHIVLIAEHEVICTQGQDDIMLDFQILRIREVLNLEKSFHFSNTLLRQVDHFILFIDNEVSRFLLFHAHDGVQLGQILHVRAALHLFCQDIAGLVQLGGFPALAGNDQRGSGLIDQNGVNLIDDGIMQVTQHQLFLINDHVVSQVVKAQFIIGHIGNILGISGASFLRLHAV